MTSEARSYKENIRRTFIRFSIVPVAIVVMTAVFLFSFGWFTYTASINEKENQKIADNISKILGSYSAMVENVEDSIRKRDMTIAEDKIYQVLYDSTVQYGDIGNLMIFSADHKPVFSSKGNYPKFMTSDNFQNWGVWFAVDKNIGKTKTLLSGGNLCIAKGVYADRTLQYAICYQVPSDVVTQTASSPGRYVLVTDQNGWVYASNTKKLLNQFGQIDERLTTHNGYLDLDGTPYYCYRTVTDQGIAIVTVSEIGRSITLIMMLIAIIAVIFMAISIISYRSTDASSEKYTKDIRKIEDAFEEVQNGNLDTKLNINSTIEFATIAKDFNDMLQGLKDQNQRNIELAEHAAFSQVKQLESQFNPHFLFNTLDNIRFMAKIDAAAADKMIISLSGLLRMTIRDTREEITVHEELENLQNYLNILQIRFNKRFAYQIDVSSDIMDYDIPKLLLQPLLENAVKYGFNGQEKLTVTVKGYQLQEKVVFICQDDGAGIEPDVLCQIRNNLAGDRNESIHYGLYNIHRRIQLMYKGDYGLDITSEVGKGTTVRLILPVRTASIVMNTSKELM